MFTVGGGAEDDELDGRASVGDIGPGAGADDWGFVVKD